jgi:MFS family permease
METWAAHARPVLAGMIGAAANLGFLLTGVVALVLKPGDYWRVILILCVLPALLTFLLRFFVPESAKWEHAVATGPKAGLGDIFVARLRGRSLLGAALGGVALFVTWGAVQTVPVWVNKTNPGLVAYVNVFSSLGAVIGSFLGAVIGARLPRRVGYLSLCVLSLVACEALFVGFAGADFKSWSYLVGFFSVLTLVGAGSASFYGWLPLYLPELFPTRVRAAGQGFCYNAGRLLAAAGVLTTTVAPFQGDYALAAALVSLVYLAGMGLVWFAPETKGQPLPE